MPYPTSQPKMKHDLVVAADGGRLPPATTPLKDSRWGYFGTTAALFHALEQPLPYSKKDSDKPFASVYSYSDAPSPPLSRELAVIGVADVSLSVVRKLIGNNDDDNDNNHSVADCLHKCRIAVKRGDGHFGDQLPADASANSNAFASLMRRLHRQGVVAILSQDKHHRFTILVPSPELSSILDRNGYNNNGHNNEDDNNYQSFDFYGVCYVGKVQAVKDYLKRNMATAVATAPPVHPEEEETDMWQPPGASGGEEVGDNLWQPPGAASANDGTGENDNDAGGFSWQPPPSGDINNAWDAAAAAPAHDYSNGGGGDGGYKRKRDDSDDDNNNNNNNNTNNNEFHADSGAAAADAFYSGLKRDLGTRADSRIYHMRAFNGWVKATQIQELDPHTTTATVTNKKGGRQTQQPLRVLDLACGKGGDLGKWVLHPRGIANYVGIDVARGSLKDAAVRARQMGRQKLERCTFTVADLGADVPGRKKSSRHLHLQKLLTWSLQNETTNNNNGEPEFKMVRGGGISEQDQFDVVSIQFAIHYMMSSRKRARRFFQTVSQLLVVGGNLVATTIDARVVVGHMMNLGLDLHFDDPNHKGEEALVSAGNGACQLRFQPEMVKRLFQPEKDGAEKDLFGLEYSFTLVEGSDHSAGVGDAVNLPEWLTPIPVLESLAEEAGLVLEYAQNFHEFFDKRSDPNTSSAAHSSLYNMKVLNRNGSLAPDEWEISRLYVAIKFRKVRESSMTLEESDDDDEEEDEDELPEIDPKVKSKLLPMAMMKAKRSVGDDAWKALSSDEKTALTDTELRKMIPKS